MMKKFAIVLALLLLPRLTLAQVVLNSGVQVGAGVGSDLSVSTLTATTSVTTPSVTLNGGTPLTSQSSANPQIVTCPTGGTGTEVCDASGAWEANGGGGTTTNALTLDNSGSGAASGSTFNGSAAVTLSYNTIGAQPTLSTYAAAAHNFLTGFTSPNAFTAAQPVFSDISGQATLAQLPSLTANTVLGALTATTPSDLALPSCSATNDALNWTSGTGFGCVTISGSGPGTGTLDAMAYWNSASTLGSVAAPTANGNYVLGYQVTGGAAVAPTATLAGLTTRLVSGTTSTDTTLYSDNDSEVEYDTSVAVAVTLPTATTLGNPHFYALLDNFTTGAGEVVTVTPTTWTVNGAASFAIQPGQGCTLSVDPASATNWLLNCGPANTPAVTGNYLSGYNAATGQFTTAALPGGAADTTITVGATVTFTANACSSVTGTAGTASTVAMTGLATTMTATFTPNSDVSAVTGWSPAAGGQLYFTAWPSAAGTLSYYVCNGTSASIITGAATTWNVSAK